MNIIRELKILLGDKVSVEDFTILPMSDTQSLCACKDSLLIFQEDAPILMICKFKSNIYRPSIALTEDFLLYLMLDSGDLVYIDLKQTKQSPLTSFRENALEDLKYPILRGEVLREIYQVLSELYRGSGKQADKGLIDLAFSTHPQSLFNPTASRQGLSYFIVEPLITPLSPKDDEQHFLFALGDNMLQFYNAYAYCTVFNTDTTLYCLLDELVILLLSRTNSEILFKLNTFSDAPTNKQQIIACGLLRLAPIDTIKFIVSKLQWFRQVVFEILGMSDSIFSISPDIIDTITKDKMKI